MAEGKETLNVELTEAIKAELFPAIRKELTNSLGIEADNNLFEYIVLLISNKRAKSHIANDLEVLHPCTLHTPHDASPRCSLRGFTMQAFFGQEAATKFTEWLWETLKTYVPASESVLSSLGDGDDEEDEEEGAPRSPFASSAFDINPSLPPPPLPPPIDPN
jgi:hypothetical protein